MTNGSKIRMDTYALTFNDILLIPQFSNIKSRLDTDISSWLTPKIKLEIPIVASNMSTICGPLAARTFCRLGAAGILHRYLTIDDQVRELQEQFDHRADKPIIPSIGVNTDSRERICMIMSEVETIDAICIDIAHGHSQAMIDQIKWIKDKWPELEIIAGNIATADGFADLAEAGADTIKIGLGSSIICSTRVVTGSGIPQATAILSCAEARLAYPEVKLIADGGIHNSGDLTKALALGADTCMIGTLLAGCIETPGDSFWHNDRKVKAFNGMASKYEQEEFKGSLTPGTVPEGIESLVDARGSVSEVVKELAGGLRSGMTYSGARTIPELHEKARFIRQSLASYQEGLTK